MKLESLKSEANLQTEPSAHDIDLLDRLGPEFNKHITSLITLSKLVPDSEEIINKISELKQLISSKVKLQSGMLEKDINNTIIAVEDVQKMYNEYKSEIGEAAWIAISKKLRSEGIKKETVDNLIDEAILKLN